ncbi:serine/threonine protein kinase [Salpingoeca rosetta]|uniref:Serine/threonine protein kinase n=1 Tax=Salpingoeca rosetta (strain ATCC 50818 / BSB-021) TaxID=946362 RepID=F2UN38_SALR5|nr:serine/threonine protein kinase [Salpingoeca rosetta]EGD78537.1 serine/threonine protein kinase [Salpingoeca rosetta]|eukprot:XP_004989486.1 serine/threonine protein kinase [Salpingoeca rosetta]
MAVATPVLVVLVLVMLVVASTKKSINVHASSTTSETVHPAIPLRPLRPQGDQLCLDVHGTLESMVHVLRLHDVPFYPKHTARNTDDSTPANTTTHKDARLPLPLLVDLSPIHRMMAAFGCGDQEDEKTDKQTDESLPARTGTEQHETIPPVPSTPSAFTPLEERVTAIRNATGNLSLQHQQQQQQRRVRRNGDPVVQAGQCTLASVVNGTCPGADSSRRLTITLREDDHVDDSTDASGLRGISDSVNELTVNGHVEEAPLRWIVNNGVWASCTAVNLQGVQFPTLQLSTLNPMTRTLTITVSDSVLLRAIGADDFHHTARLTAFRAINNSLTSVPDVSNMTSLSILNLHGNRIRCINDDTFNGLTLLQQLFFSENILSEIESRAFDDLTALNRLILAINDMSAIPSGLFHRLTSLTTLQLQQNPITKLDADVFAQLTMLERLTLERTLLTQLPATLFRNTTRLVRLDLAINFITSLDETVFSGLSSLEHLQIFDNRLTSLPPGVFKDLTTLTWLGILRNDLTSLPDKLLEFNPQLRTFFCNDNDLASLPANLFVNNAALFRINLANNALRSIDTALESAKLSSLQFLDVGNNQLTRLQLTRTLPSLTLLGLDDNPMQELPDVTLTPSLETLRLQNHGIKHMDLAPVLRLPSLEVLELDALLQANSRAVLTDTNITSITRLSTLSLENVDVSAAVPSFKQHPPLSLNVLHVGWPGAMNRTLPITEVCRMLKNSVRELRIANTDYRAIELCPDKTFESLLLNDNRHLRSVTVHNPLRELNVSGCTQLTSIDAPPIDILDISNTKFPPTGALCTRWGRRVLFARKLDEKAFNSIRTVGALTNCIDQVDVLDLSGNTWLNNPAEINRVAERRVVMSDEEFWTADLVAIPNRRVPPILQLTDAPIDCALHLSNQDLRPRTDTSVLTTEIVFSFRCVCAQGHHLSGNGECVEDVVPLAAIVAGSVFAVLALSIPLLVWLYRRYWRSHKSDSLHQQLLNREREEVQALKRAWVIEYDELRMIKRVAAGAYGVVFKAEWDTVTVAVKVLQRTLSVDDRETANDIGNEVEFLQRTRHPNVVRFFGAGVNTNGSPFLVLEFVAMGSLKDLLERDMDAVLHEVRAQVLEAGDDDDDDDGDGEKNKLLGADVHEELTLVSTSLESHRTSLELDEMMSVWDLKLQLLRDVANGMAFIHSLDQMHRDLKSGNVLVSSRLRAKITDFGSIRECLERGTDGNDDDDGDVEDGNRGDGTATTSFGDGGRGDMTMGVGTPMYMAPEALLTKTYNAKADVFSFGVLMWEVATQREPDLIAQEKPKYRGPPRPMQTTLLQEGKRLRFEDFDGQPLAVAEWYKELAYTCMADNPAHRPSFEELKNKRLAEQQAV